MPWWAWVLIGVGVLIASWMLLVLLAARLPDGQPDRARRISAGLWHLSPLDDGVVVALAVRYTARQVPRSILLEAWPGHASSIERVLGPVRKDRKHPRHDSGDADPARP